MSTESQSYLHHERPTLVLSTLLRRLHLLLVPLVVEAFEKHDSSASFPFVVAMQ